MTTEDTANFRNPHPVQSTPEHLRAVRESMNALIETLRGQQNLLRQRGMNLPAGAMERLKYVVTGLDKLLPMLTNQQIELRQLRALAETTALINSSVSTDEVLNQVMDTVIQLTGAERGYIMLRNPATSAMEFRIARGIDREQLGRDDFMVSNTIVKEVVDTALPVLTDNARNDPRYQSQESIVGYQLRSILAVPLSVRGDVIGVVYCDNRVLAGLFKDHELNLLIAFANQAAVAIQNARLFESARARLAEVTEIRDVMDNIFTSIASGLIVIDKQDLITAYNPAAEAILGVRREQALGCPVCDVLYTLSPRFEETVTRVRAENTPEEYEIAVQLGDGGRRVWNISAAPLRDHDSDGPTGSSEAVVFLMDDLTELKAREAQLAQVRRYLPVALVDNIRSEELFSQGGQEREITLLFADVRGFTSFSERLQPEVLMEVINKYLSVASDSINLFEGIVEKYIGDAVTGIFNSQLNPQADHALRAVRAAMSIIYDVIALHETLPEDQRLFYGIGIHSGSAVLGNVGSPTRREFAAMGDVTEMCKLLQENAQRGEVIISADTYALVSAYFEVEALTPRVTKGRADFTIMYKVLGRKRRTTGTLRAPTTVQ
ncbi:MAG: adenylate/guanylate cyclase domain-containing protein [bacterium]|nr:adenylate/guanylate cyclase domain-containing protein [bacterium]